MEKFEAPFGANKQKEAASGIKENESREENYEKMLAIFSMFGTDETRENFNDLVSQYYDKVKEQKLKSETEAKIYIKGRAEIHDKIMRTLQKLSLRSKSGSPEEKLLQTLGNREDVTKMVGDYFEEKFQKEHPKLSEFGEKYRQFRGE